MHKFAILASVAIKINFIEISKQIILDIFVLEFNIFLIKYNYYCNVGQS